MCSSKKNIYDVLQMYKYVCTDIHTHPHTYIYTYTNTYKIKYDMHIDMCIYIFICSLSLMPLLSSSVSL